MSLIKKQLMALSLILSFQSVSNSAVDYECINNIECIKNTINRTWCLHYISYTNCSGDWNFANTSAACNIDVGFSSEDQTYRLTYSIRTESLNNKSLVRRSLVLGANVLTLGAVGDPLAEHDINENIEKSIQRIDDLTNELNHYLNYRYIPRCSDFIDDHKNVIQQTE